jgi:hypothetical protein
LERLAKYKHSSLLLKSENYDREKFYSTGPSRKSVSDEEKKFNCTGIRITTEILNIMKTIPEAVTAMTGIELNKHMNGH